jgi:hypothetical protein
VAVNDGCTLHSDRPTVTVTNPKGIVAGMWLQLAVIGVLLLTAVDSDAIAMHTPQPQPRSIESAETTTTTSLKADTGTTYYISSALGDDSNAGTVVSAPWQSLERAQRVQLRSADALLLRRGDSWIIESGDGLVLTNASGTIGAYQDGNTTLVKSQPLIQVSSRGAWAACVRLFDPTDLTVSAPSATSVGCTRLSPHDCRLNVA